MSTPTGAFTPSKIKKICLIISIASFLGMLASFNEAQKIISVPSVEDSFLNKPITAIYKNPNQGFFRNLGIFFMLLSSTGAYFSARPIPSEKKEKASKPEPKSIQLEAPNLKSNSDESIFEESIPSSGNPQSSWFFDPWEGDLDSKNWIFESEYEHPALNYKNWPDQLGLLIYGEQGGGKSSKLLWLAEEHLKRGNIVLIASDFAYPGWIKGIEVAGINGDFRAIAQAVGAFCNEAEARKKYAGVYRGQGYFAHDLPSIVLIADEVTSWSQQPELEMIIHRLSRIILQDLRQTNARIYLGGHGNTLATLFGKALAGKKGAFDNQLIQIQCRAVQDPSIENGKRCAGEVNIKYFSEDQKIVNKRVKIPPLLPSAECTKIVRYKTPEGKNSKKITYDFSSYSGIPFSEYHARENEKRAKLIREA